MNRVKRRLDFEGAFECHACPGNNDPEKGRACPAWWAWEEKTENVPGIPQEKRIVEQCGAVVGQRFIVEMMANNHFATENVVNSANRMDQCVEGMVTAVEKLPDAIANHISRLVSTHVEPAREAPFLTRALKLLRLA